MMEELLILAIPAAVPPAAAELFVAAVLGLIGLNIHKTARPEHAARSRRAAGPKPRPRGGDGAGVLYLRLPEGFLLA
jgi:hypothetical protein